MNIRYCIVIFIALFVFCSGEAFSQNEPVDSNYVDTTYYEGYYYDDDYYQEDEYYDDENYDDVDYSDEIEENNTLLGEGNISFKSPLPPMGDFSASPFGFEIGVYKQIFESKPIYVGGSFFMDFYDNHTVYYNDYSTLDGIEYEYSESLNANMLGFGAGLKLFSPVSLWRFNPYFGMNLEWRYAFSTINVTNLDLNESENSDFEGGNSNFGYDVGIGSIVDIKSEHIYLNFKISISSGGGLYLYQKKEEIDSLNVRDFFDRKYFPVSFLTFRFGLVFN